MCEECLNVLHYFGKNCEKLTYWLHAISFILYFILRMEQLLPQTQSKQNGTELWQFKNFKKTSHAVTIKHFSHSSSKMNIKKFIWRIDNPTQKMLQMTVDKYTLICKYNGCLHQTLSTGKWIFLKITFFTEL